MTLVRRESSYTWMISRQENSILFISTQLRKELQGTSSYQHDRINKKKKPTQKHDNTKKTLIPVYFLSNFRQYLQKFTDVETLRNLKLQQAAAVAFPLIFIAGIDEGRR